MEAQYFFEDLGVSEEGRRDAVERGASGRRTIFTKEIGKGPGRSLFARSSATEGRPHLKQREKGARENEPYRVTHSDLL